MAEDTKIAEFRSTNIELLKNLETSAARIASLEAAVAAQAVPDPRIAELESRLAAAAVPDPRLAALEAEVATTRAALATEAAARALATQKAARGLIRDVVRTIAMPAGVLPAAVETLLEKADAVFQVVTTAAGDSVVAKDGIYSQGRPGEKLTPADWVVEATTAYPFLFGASAGAGATGSKFGSRTAGVKELRDPTPQQLGQFAKEISRGELKVTSSSD